MEKAKGGKRTNEKKRLRMWGQAAAKWGLTPEEVAMGLKLGISWRSLGVKKNMSEGRPWRTLGGYIRMRFHQEFGPNARVKVPPQVEAAFKKQAEWLRSQREATARGRAKAIARAEPVGETPREADGLRPGPGEIP